MNEAYDETSFIHGKVVSILLANVIVREPIQHLAIVDKRFYSQLVSFTTNICIALTFC